MSEVTATHEGLGNGSQMVRIPKALVHGMGAYYETRAFSCLHGVKFNKDMVLNEIRNAAEKHHFEVEGETGSFTLHRKGKTLRVTPESFPMAVRVA